MKRSAKEGGAFKYEKRFFTFIIAFHLLPWPAMIEPLSLDPS
jgi:hypothetical protein